MADTDPPETMVRIAEHTFPRGTATVLGVIVGILVGIGNTYLDLDFSSNVVVLSTLLVAIVAVLFLHEGIHGAVGWILGHRPTFGVEPPLVYTTFVTKLPRDHLIAVALAPLLILDALFVGLYALGVFKLFNDLAFAVNTIGSVGDLWIVAKLVRHPRASLIQDTKTGVAVWLEERS